MVDADTPSGDRHPGRDCHPQYQSYIQGTEDSSYAQPYSDEDSEESAEPSAEYAEPAEPVEVPVEPAEDAESDEE
ncbi:hypothetical protein [Pseudomonas viridiflava]|uniref:hypothetical protein n=1 Tax=Pseudomonas viridiflava TaxID=33069 RepID=UPI0013DF485F|nr:hypothetical protein [Pseudomonas viridiflava]